MVTFSVVLLFCLWHRCNCLFEKQLAVNNLLFFDFGCLTTDFKVKLSELCFNQKTKPQLNQKSRAISFEILSRCAYIAHISESFKKLVLQSDKHSQSDTQTNYCMPLGRVSYRIVFGGGGNTHSRESREYSPQTLKGICIIRQL